jgi:hypothetical protein
MFSKLVTLSALAIESMTAYSSNNYFKYSYMSLSHDDWIPFKGVDAYSASHELLAIADGSG